jgi:hypothetical protein
VISASGSAFTAGAAAMVNKTTEYRIVVRMAVGSSEETSLVEDG